MPAFDITPIEREHKRTLMYYPIQLWSREDHYNFQYKGIRPICWLVDGDKLVRVNGVIEVYKEPNNPLSFFNEPKPNETVVYEGPEQEAPPHLRMFDEDDHPNAQIRQVTGCREDGCYVTVEMVWFTEIKTAR